MIGKRKCTNCNEKVPYLDAIFITKNSVQSCDSCNKNLSLASPEFLYWGFLGILPMLISGLFEQNIGLTAILGVLGIGCYYNYIPLKTN